MTVVSVGDAANQAQRGADLLSPELLATAENLFADALTIIVPLAAATARPELPYAVEQLSAIFAQLQQARATLAEVREAATVLIAAWAGVDGISTQPSLPVSPVNLTAERVLAANVPSAALDQRAAELLAKLPLRTGGSGQKTSGYWIGEDGSEHGPLVSGQDEDYQNAKEVLRSLNIGPRFGELFAASHVETKFAARLRVSRSRRVVLVINNRPCDDGRFSCDRLMARILRPDQEVTLYWPGGKATYRGREA